jgi:hypothetical protein
MAYGKALTSTLHGGEWSASRSGRLTARERAAGTHYTGGSVGPRAGLDAVEKRFTLVPIGQEAEWAPEPVWTEERFTPVPIVQEAGWAPEPVWTLWRGEIYPDTHWARG